MSSYSDKTLDELLIVHNKTLKQLLMTYVRGLTEAILDATLNYTPEQGQDNPCNVAMDIFEGLCRNTKCFLVGKEPKPDRHKLAACMCGAIMQAQVLRRIYDFQGKNQHVNAALAVHFSLYIIKLFMVEQYLMDHSICVNPATQCDICDTFDMELPDINGHGRDKKSYEQNLLNALVRSYGLYPSNRKIKDFDIWVYSIIFYHIEQYNIDRLAQFMTKYPFPPT